MILLILMYKLRFILNERLGIMSDLMLTYISFNCIFKLLKNFYFQRFKNFCIAKIFLENKKLTKPPKNY